MSNQPVYWKMRNGRLISVDDMDINHLRNVLKMIICNREKALQQLQAKSKVKFNLNGDMAQEFNNSYISDENDELLDEMHHSHFPRVSSCNIDIENLSYSNIESNRKHNVKVLCPLVTV